MIISVSGGQVNNTYKDATVSHIIAELFLELESTCNDTLECQRIRSKIDSNKNIPTGTLIRMMQAIDRDKLWKEERSKKKITYKGVSLSFAAELPKVIKQARRQWWKIVKKVNEINALPRTIYPDRLLFGYEENI